MPWRTTTQSRVGFENVATDPQRRPDVAEWLNAGVLRRHRIQYARSVVDNLHSAREFSKTVAQNKNGRDHNKRPGCLFLAGGGFKGGLTYGATDDVVTGAKVHPEIINSPLLS